MPAENVNVVRAAFAAFIGNDTAAVLELCAEDVEITQPPDLPGVSARQFGHEGVLEAFGIWPAHWDQYRVEPPRVVGDAGDHVVAVSRTSGRGKESGVEVEMDFAFAFTVRQQKIVGMQIFFTEDEALEAVGLRE